MAKKPTFYVLLTFDEYQDRVGSLISRIRNFGEALFYDMRSDPRLDFDFKVIDAAVDRFYFTATSKTLARRAAARAEKLLQEAKLKSRCPIGSSIPESTAIGVGLHFRLASDRRSGALA